MNKCKDYDVPPSIIPACKRIISIGDIHGDAEATIRAFRIAGLIDSKRNWIANPPDTIVIQVGDILDRHRDNMNSDENSEKKIMNFFDLIHKKAKKFGGGVYCLLGNHEFMNVNGIMNYTSKMGIDGFGGLENRKRLFAPGNKMAVRLACTRNVLMKVGDFLFVHAGLANNPKNYSIDKINDLMRQYLLGETKTIDSALFQSKNSYLWSRELAHEDVKCKDINKKLKFFNVGKIIIGHTIQPNGINSICNNKVWRIDVGMSKAFNNHGAQIQVLEILDNGLPSPSNSFKPIRVLS